MVWILNRQSGTPLTASEYPIIALMWHHCFILVAILIEVCAGCSFVLWLVKVHAFLLLKHGFKVQCLYKRVLASQ